MKNQKGFANLILVGVVIVLAITVFVVVKRGCWISGKFYFYSTCNSQGVVDDPVLLSETSIIQELKTNWQSVQVGITFRPDHPGTTSWGGPNRVQFIGNNSVIVGFEDGYNPGMAILSFKDNKFIILETFKNEAEFTLPVWQSLVKKYGNSNYSVSTYTGSLLRNKEIVSFEELTKVPENVFLKNYYK